MVSLLVLFSGKIATYLEEADEIFLLPKEKEVLQIIHVAARRTYILWSGIQVLVQMLLVPIYLMLLSVVQREGFEPPKANAKRFTVSRV